MTQLASVDLEDKYRRADGPIFISGPQALVRIPLVQRRLDQAAGLNTAGFISGYRGSPLGVYDLALTRAARELDASHIEFVPGVNEELAATAVYGSQQLDMYGPARYDGVFGIWYGKGPGVDRAGDALKHGNLAGSHRNGGVLVLAGDDHTAKSSTTAHQSEQALAAALIPVLYPADVQDYLDFGAFGFAMSRFAGLWTGFKCVNDTADATATVLARSAYDFVRPEVAIPEGGLNIRAGDLQLDHERKHVDFRLPAAQAFAYANGLDRVVQDGPRRELAIVTAGKVFHDVMEALGRLGLAGERGARLGVRVYKLGLTWPIEPRGALAFCAGHRNVLVVEEKRAFIEPQLKDLLYHLPAQERPAVWGKSEPSGRPLYPSIAELNPDLCLSGLIRVLDATGLADPPLAARITELRGRNETPPAPATDIVRSAFFCSGCPHNRSTVVPDGSIAIAGIGCHAMAGAMSHRLHKWPTQMGGEGANWIGIAPFTETKHVFQNLGDGTYFHSGFLAIRAAVAAGRSITYKLLVNDAVAMTGGQPVEGQLSVSQMAGELLQEGVRRLVVVTDEPDKYGPGQLPASVEVHHRDELDAVQRELREVPGVTVLIYDQVCAAEKRRRRKRGLLPEPDRRVFINDRVCEGCGDCTVKSNCVSVTPLDTEFGRKRLIDQSNCNKDFSCLEGFCPSFVTVVGGSQAGPKTLPHLTLPALPEPDIAPLTGARSVLITGIGGTGVVTVGAVLGMAAHLEGKAASIVDMTGMSQKNGAVLSHVKLAADASQIHAAQVSGDSCDLLLACDLVVAGGAGVVNTLRPAATVGVVNTHLQPTAAFQVNPDVDFRSARITRRLAELCAPETSLFFDAARAARVLLGDTIGSNMLILGAALQRGLLPVTPAALERAIELNGVSVAMNTRALALGRFAAADPVAFQALVDDLDASPTAQASTVRSDDLDAIVERRIEELTAYQDADWAAIYRAQVEKVRVAEQAVVGGAPLLLTEAVARYAFKLMAYKDEYEVARLHADPEFHARLTRQFGQGYRLRYHLSPPLFAPRDRATGLPRKLTFGPWMLGVFRFLAHFRALRGTPFDPFGWTAERRSERALIRDYFELLDEVVAELRPDNRALAVEIASYPEGIRGYGHVKARHVAQARGRLETLLAQWRASDRPAEAA